MGSHIHEHRRSKSKMKNELLLSNYKVTNPQTTKATLKNLWICPKRLRPRNITIVKCGCNYKAIATSSAFPAELGYIPRI